MWLFLKSAVLGWILKQTLGRMVAVLLGLLLPLATILKLAGLPLLIVLVAIGTPLFLLLAVIGLPLLLVSLVVGLLVVAIGAALKIGFMLLAIAVPVILLIWLLRGIFGGSDGGGATGEVQDGPLPGES